MAFIWVTNGRAAAPPVLVLQHRRLDLEKPAGVQRLPQRPIDCGTQFHRPTGLRPHDQVHVALPDPGVLGQRLVSDRQRPDGLGGELPAVGQHAEFAAA